MITLDIFNIINVLIFIGIEKMNLLWDLHSLHTMLVTMGKIISNISHSISAIVTDTDQNPGIIRGKITKNSCDNCAKPSIL